MEYDEVQNRFLDDNGEPIVEGVFYKVRKLLGEPVPPYHLLLKKVPPRRLSSMPVVFTFEDFAGNTVSREMFMDDQVHRYSPEELRVLVSTYRSAASWIEQHVQTQSEWEPMRSEEIANAASELLAEQRGKKYAIE